MWPGKDDSGVFSIYKLVPSGFQSSEAALEAWLLDLGAIGAIPVALDVRMTIRTGALQINNVAFAISLNTVALII